jgi:hypothetical protein
MASPRRHSTLIELIRDRPTSFGPGAPVRAVRIKPEPVGRPRAGGSDRGGGFDIASMGRMFAAGRRLNLPMGYVFIVAALILASWIGMYMIGYSRAQGLIEEDRIARLTSSSDPLLAESAPAIADNPRRNATNPGPMRTPTSRPTPQVSSNGPTGTGLPDRAASNQRNTPATAGANRAAAVLPPAKFEPGLNYLVIANYHRDEAQSAAAFLIDNGVQATVAPVNNGATWNVIGLRGFTGEQMRAGDHRQYRESVEALGKSWERDHKGADNFSGMFFRKEKG